MAFCCLLVEPSGSHLSALLRSSVSSGLAVSRSDEPLSQQIFFLSVRPSSPCWSQEVTTRGGGGSWQIVSVTLPCRLTWIIYAWCNGYLYSSSQSASLIVWDWFLFFCSHFNLAGQLLLWWNVTSPAWRRFWAGDDVLRLKIMWWTELASDPLSCCLLPGLVRLWYQHEKSSKKKKSCCSVGFRSWV